MKILVADDSQVDQMIIRRYLLSMNHEVLLANDGEQAIILFKQQDPDLILLDVHMPIMDGYDVVKQIRELEQGWRPVLFLSNSVDTESFTKGIYAGADDYLHKPIDKIVLQAKLHAMERIVGMRQQLIQLSEKLSKETDKANEMANQDGLTGIANRRHLNSVLEKEFRRHLRSKKTLSLIMIDIDYFKSYNDHYGHLAGDDALRSCAQTLSKLLYRAGDMVARYGGEEFCVVLPNTEPEGAQSIARTLCKEIESLNITRDDLDDYHHLTISLGVSSLRPEINAPIESLINKADQALYQAKQAGRNQVCVIID